MIYYNARDLARGQSARFRRWAVDMRSKHREACEGSLQDARELTSGSGAPKGSYARRGLLRGGGNLLPINRQTGRLYSGFYIRRVPHSQGQAFELLNQKDYAKYILSPVGTKFMVSRGFAQEMARRAMKRNLETVKAIRTMTHAGA